MQQRNEVLAQSLKTWRGYAGLTRAVAFDYEQSLAVVSERAGHREVLTDVALIVDMGRLTNTVTVTYCNRTGQPIGLGFVSAGAGERGLGYNASIAPQWIKTGPNALAKHVKQTPIAYTVYLVGKLLPKPDTVEGVNKRVKLLAGLYAVLSGVGFAHGSDVSDKESAVLVSAMQTALWICSKLAKVSKSHHFGVMFAKNIDQLLSLCDAIIDNNVSDALGEDQLLALYRDGLNIWVGNVLGRLANGDMPKQGSKWKDGDVVNTVGNDADALELAESLIAKALKDVSFASTSGETAIPVSSNMTEFSNLPQAGRAQVSGWGKTKAREQETKKVVAGLGDIFKAAVNAGAGASNE